ncbi:mechanosensitive ion channel family protein [Solitalea sp. MAHUQ-68]|uniref:Mechanosensitive ion channel family protein n=1 Tax=Solitalea agri TaxID=2953739 RepID=A0A9X2F923_9SPHI|nr:mechanosensitive ion channel domain-containing protein [Solitalea agri]MCO4292738.1 mechanosensitive ion channel family protein [Solitalea agri]
MILVQLLERVYWGNSLNNYIWCAGILFFGLLFKRIISKFLSRLIFRLFERFAGGDTAVKFVELLVRPIELLILFVSIYFSINQLDHPLNKPIFNRTVVVEQTVKETVKPANEAPKTTATEKKTEQSLQASNEPHVRTYADLIDKLFELLALGTFFWILLRIIDFIAFALFKKATENDYKAGLQLIPFTRELVKIIVGSLGFFIIMSVVFNLNVGLIVSGLGIGGLALALAGKETVENLFGAFTIFIDKPFIVGDHVVVGGVEGVVEKVGFRSTRIRTTEKSLVSMPNKKIVDNPMDNLTEKSLRKVKLTLALDYATTPDQLKKITSEIEAQLKSTKHIDADITVAFEGFGESALIVTVSYFVEMIPANDHTKLKESIVYKILEIISSNNAEIAFPTRKVLHESVGGINLTD